MRGQGIKIFSLVAKKCRLKSYLIPNIRKPYNKPKQVDFKKMTALEIENYKLEQKRNKNLAKEQEAEKDGAEKTGTKKESQRQRRSRKRRYPLL